MEETLQNDRNLGRRRRKKLSVLDDKRDSLASEETFSSTLAIRDESNNIDLSPDSD